jgi:hypothetical protein
MPLRSHETNTILLKEIESLWKWLWCRSRKLFPAKLQSIAFNVTVKRMMIYGWSHGFIVVEWRGGNFRSFVGSSRQIFDSLAWFVWWRITLSRLGNSITRILILYGEFSEVVKSFEYFRLFDLLKLLWGGIEAFDSSNRNSFPRRERADKGRESSSFLEMRYESSWNWYYLDSNKN